MKIVHIIAAILALIPLAFGFRWLQIFIFTDYRAHHRPIMIPLGIATTIIGFAILGWALSLLRRGRNADKPRNGSLR